MRSPFSVFSACLLLSTLLAGCQTTGNSTDLDPLAQWQAGKQKSITAHETQVARTIPPSPQHVPSAPSPGVALVSHEVPATIEPITKAIPATYTPESYPGVYESAGFRHRLQSGLEMPGCGDCQSCEPTPNGCACCQPAACPTPIPCRFPGDPNEYLCDGGDRMPEARVLLSDDVGGLGLEDTIVHYETGDRLTHVRPSNRVCVYAPRYAAIRKVTAAVTGQNIIATQRVDLPNGPANLDLRQPSSAVMLPVGPERNVRAIGLDALRERNRGVPAENVMQPLLAADVIAVLQGLSIIERGILREADKPWLANGAQAAIAWASEEGPQVVVDEEVVSFAIQDQKPDELSIVEVGEGRVRLIKLADRKNALPGEFVHFVLRFDNVGDQPVSKVAILDNLTTRLEYVDGSQTCTKGAKFSVRENEGASLRLRWELTETLDIGEGCVIRFKCKVR